MKYVSRWVITTAVLSGAACGAWGQTTILPGGCVQPGRGGGWVTSTGRRVIPPQNTYGIGRSSVPRINMIHRGWTETIDPVVCYPRPCPPRPRPEPTPLPDRPDPRAEAPRSGPRAELRRRAQQPAEGVVVGVGASGVRVAGSYSGEKWNVAFGLNTGLGVSGGCADVPTYPQCSWWQPVSCGGYYPYYDGYYGYGWPYYGSVWNWGTSPVTYYYDGYLDPQLLHTPMPMNQASASAAPAAPATPPTAFERGIDALREGDSFRAAAELWLYLRGQPSDARAMRFLAVALIQEKDLDNAASVMRMAYRVDPKLASEPLDYATLGIGDRAFRELLNRTVLRANKAKTGSSWLLVATLMQAEGRRATALQMLNRANTLGLEPDVFASLSAELSRG